MFFPHSFFVSFFILLGFTTGFGTLLATYIYMMCWQYTSECASKRIRENYLRATLRQELAYFDDLGPGEVATRIQTDTNLVQTGMSEKVGLTLQYLSTFCTGFIREFFRFRFRFRFRVVKVQDVPFSGILGSITDWDFLGVSYR